MAYIPTNEVIWTINNNIDTNKNYEATKKKLESLIKKCHNLLYSECSIVGSKAQDDIMKLLTIKILQSQFNDKNSKLYKKCLEVKKKFFCDKDFKCFMTNCTDLNSLFEYDHDEEEDMENDPFDEWSNLVNKFLSRVTNIYEYETDDKFNVSSVKTFIELLRIIQEFEIDKNFTDTYSSTCGDIHEAFRSYSGGKGAKDLGQFFTPRNLIHVLFYGTKFDTMFEKLDNPKIYDPCMGTGGFLTRLYQLGNVKAKNIYGCETELSTIKFAETSIALTTNKFSDKLFHCNSLCENPLLFTTKVDCIVTNPPFGTRIKYDFIKDSFDRFKSKYKDSNVEFKDIYPLKMNNGACLFVQHCVYMLKDKGLCAIVLPYGEIFNGLSQWAVKFRKWLLENTKVYKIIFHEGGTFEHAGVATATIIFTKGCRTKKIQFMKTSKECDNLIDIFTVKYKDIKKNSYIISHSEYEEPEKETDYGVVMKTLGEVCETINGKIIKSKHGLKEGLYPLYFCSVVKILYHNEYNYNNEGIIINKTNGSGKYKIHYYNGKYNVGETVLHFKANDKALTKYIYYYLLIMKTQISKLYKGINQKSIKFNELQKLKIPVPSIEKQKEIIKQIDIVNNVKESSLKFISDLKEAEFVFKKQINKHKINKIIEKCEMKTLGEVCEIIKGDVIKSKHGKETGNYPLYYCSVVKILYYDTYNYNNECIIINKTNGSGKFKIHYYNGKYNVGETVLHFKGTNVLTKYIYYYLLTIKNKISKLYKGINQKSIKYNELMKLKIPIPSIEKQEELIKLYTEIKVYINDNNKLCESLKKNNKTYDDVIKNIIISNCSNEKDSESNISDNDEDIIKESDSDISDNDEDFD